MKQTGYPFCICCKNNPDTRLDWVFFVVLSRGRLQPGKILANRAAFCPFQLECVTSKGEKKMENEERQQSKKSPCTGRWYCVQSDLGLQLLTSALENMSVFLPGLFKWWNLTTTVRHTLHTHTNTSTLISMKSEATKLPLYLENIILSLILSSLHNCLDVFVWNSIHIDTSCMCETGLNDVYIH